MSYVQHIIPATVVDNANDTDSKDKGRPMRFVNEWNGKANTPSHVDWHVPQARPRSTPAMLDHVGIDLTLSIGGRTISHVKACMKSNQAGYPSL